MPKTTAETPLRCVRCRARFRRPGHGKQSAQRTAAATLAALILFWPAILLPILKVERFGHWHNSSLLSGIMEMLKKGEWFVGTVVLVFSIVFPLLKMLLLLELCLLGVLHARHKAVTYRLVEHVGRWSMMDVMLLAFLVMLVKIGNLVTFHIGPAVIAFVLCVSCSLIASLTFDSREIWEEPA